MSFNPEGLAVVGQDPEIFLKQAIKQGLELPCAGDRAYS
jgi:hypothetical protein